MFLFKVLRTRSTEQCRMPTTVADVILSLIVLGLVLISDKAEISPLVFPACPRGPGRPKEKREGAPKISNKRPHEEGSNENDQQPKKRRGRPPGAKNKPKEAQPTMSLRDRAENALNFELEENDGSFDKTCRICLFLLDDPIKINKGKTNCPPCNFVVHEPCLTKDGCNCSIFFLQISSDCQ